MLRTVLSGLAALCVGLAAAVPAATADLGKGVAAYRAGYYETAFVEFRRLAEQGDVRGQFNLGVLYLTGRGVTRDLDKAVEWHRKAAEQGLAAAEHGLGVLYYQGTGVDQDYDAAAKWFRRAAAQGFANSEFNLAAMSYNGQGMKRDDREILKWTSLAAARDFGPAQFRLGEMYENGIIFRQDAAQALHWYRLAAKNGEGATARDAAARVAKQLGMEPAAVAKAPAALGPTVEAAAASATAVPVDAPADAGPVALTAEAPEREVAPATADEAPPATGTAPPFDPAAADPVSAATAESPAPAAGKPVRIAAASDRPAGASGSTATGARSAGAWRIQLAAFRTVGEADAAWRRLSAGAGGEALAGLEPAVERADLGERGIYHRLQAGRFDGRAAARAACLRLQEALPQQGCMAVHASAPGVRP